MYDGDIYHLLRESTKEVVALVSFGSEISNGKALDATHQHSCSCHHSITLQPRFCIHSRLVLSGVLFQGAI